MKLAVIPARGGSKRIPRKNLKVFCGKPIIAWSIAAALDSGCFDQVVVSTDDEEIRDIGRANGASVPFLRPAGLADDHTATAPVVAHAIDWFRQEGNEPSVVCCLYATAPFVRPEDLRAGLGILERETCDFVFTITSYAFPIQRALVLNPDGRVEMLDPAYADVRSQDLQDAYHDAGQFYWGRADAWLQGRPIFAPASVPLILPRHRVQDIDTIEDWERAERLFKTA